MRLLVAFRPHDLAEAVTVQVVELLFESAGPCPQQEEDEQDDAEAEREPSSVRNFFQGGTEEETVDESGSEEVL